MNFIEAKHKCMLAKQKCETLRYKLELQDYSDIEDVEIRRKFDSILDGLKDMVERNHKTLSLCEENLISLEKINNLLEETFFDKVLEYLMFNSWPWYFLIIITTILYGISCN